MTRDQKVKAVLLAGHTRAKVELSGMQGFPSWDELSDDLRGNLERALSDILDGRNFGGTTKPIDLLVVQEMRAFAQELGLERLVVGN